MISFYHQFYDLPRLNDTDLRLLRHLLTGEDNRPETRQIFYPCEKRFIAGLLSHRAVVRSADTLSIPSTQETGPVNLSPEDKKTGLFA